MISISKPKLLTVACLILAFTATWEGYVLATPSPTISRVVTPGNIGPCTWFISLDGTTPLAEAMTGGLSVSPGDNVVGTTGQDMTTFVNGLSSLAGELCLSPQTFTFNSQWPSSNIFSTTLLVGSGPSTLVNPGGAANFDPINVTLVQTRDFRMTDKHGIVSDFTFDSVGLDQSLQSIPLDLAIPAADFAGTSVTLLGNYLRTDTNGLTGKFPAITSGFAVVLSNGTSATFPYHRLIVQATVRAGTVASFFPFFMEPIKGEFGNFIGFEWVTTTTLTMLTKVGGTTTTLTSSKTLDTLDHTYKIDYVCCVAGVTKVTFYYDGIQQQVSTTNIYQYPSGASANTAVLGPTLECCEPNGVDMATYLKTPFIQAVTKNS